MDRDQNKIWCIAQIKQNLYQTAIKNLERQGYETFVPKMEKTIRENNKFFIRYVNVFPGYIFVSFNPHIVSWTKINYTYGISKILSFSNKPAEISSDLILELKCRYEININPIQKNILQKGDSIKFHRGPFTELIAKVESVDKNHRIWVLLESLGGIRKIKLQNVEKLKYSKL